MEKEGKEEWFGIANCLFKVEDILRMKKKNHKHDKNDYDDLEEEYNRPPRKSAEKRRPIRNWRHAWEERQKDYDELDDFYAD